jgi:hypothetical protein
METYQSVAAEAGDLLEKTLIKLAEATLKVSQEQPERTVPLFFPKGIELVYLSFKVGDKIELALAIAGPDAKYPPKSASDKPSMTIIESDALEADQSQ